MLAVGGLLLLPLYTRTLSQTDFGTYVVVKTNAELLTYVLYFGLPSAVARVYFDHRNSGRAVQYMSSIVTFFCLVIVLSAVLFWIAGERLWHLLSPGAPAYPYLWFSFAIASVSFFGNLGPLWLRLEERVHAFIAIQVCSALLLAGIAVLFLVKLQLGVNGIFMALVLSSAVAGAVLPWLFGRDFRPVIDVLHIRESLRFAAPIVAGYVAYFVLNRTGVLVLQQHVPPAELAVFGLAQQLALAVSIVGTSFGKAIQPAVFAAAEPALARQVLNRSGRLLILVMFAITSAGMLFGPEILALVAPPRYAAAYELFLILAWANLAYSFNIIFNTALIYQRRAMVSLVVTVSGAVLAVAFSFWLIPGLRLRGAAFASAAAFALTILLAQLITRRFMEISHLRSMLAALAAAALLGRFAWWMREQLLPPSADLAIKSAVAVAVGGSIYLLTKMQDRDGVRWGA